MEMEIKYDNSIDHIFIRTTEIRQSERPEASGRVSNFLAFLFTFSAMEKVKACSAREQMYIETANNKITNLIALTCN